MLKGIVTAVYVLICLLLITVVVLQSGRAAGLSGASGGAESLFGKKKGLDEWLTKVTVWVAVLFGALSLLLVVWR
ncbi:preprotein translocase subunit SecG [Thermodesulfitimonas sp.]